MADKQGIQEATLAVARKLLTETDNTELVAKVTGLSLDKITELQS